MILNSKENLGFNLLIFGKKNDKLIVKKKCKKIK